MSQKNNSKKIKKLSPSEGPREAEEWTVKELIDNYIYDIDLDADYQREKVWYQKDQERLINSILFDIDIPKIYLAKVNGDYECIDGKQRMLTLLEFLKPDKTEKKILSVDYLGKKYTFKQLEEKHPDIAKKIEDYKLNFVIYKRSYLSEDFIRKIFIRLQLGVRLNSGEILHAHMGTIRDFIFKEIGNNGPFFRNTNLSDKRFSRPFTLAQICINSFSRRKTGKFDRARLEDLETFFEANRDLEMKDENLVRIRKVLEIMDSDFGEKAKIISSRATTVSAYLFAEDLYLGKKKAVIKEFAKFYILFLEEIKSNMKLLRSFEKPDNSLVMEGFQRYISQATVEPYAITNRNEFLKRAFDYYLNPKTKGKIIGGK